MMTDAETPPPLQEVTGNQTETKIAQDRTPFSVVKNDLVFF